MARIQLCGKYGNDQFMLVDQDKQHIFRQWRWNLRRTGYVESGRMHAHHLAFYDDPRFPLIYEVHHVNGNPLDNRLCNLVPIRVNSKYGKRLQAQVKRKFKGESKYRGVYTEKIAPKLFRARARNIGGAPVSLGYYKTEEECRDVYEKHEKWRVAELTRLVLEEFNEDL